jgi:hypothetical protein
MSILSLTPPSGSSLGNPFPLSMEMEKKSFKTAQFVEGAALAGSAAATITLPAWVVPALVAAAAAGLGISLNQAWGWWNGLSAKEKSQRLSFFKKEKSQANTSSEFVTSIPPEAIGNIPTGVRGDLIKPGSVP